MARPTTIHHHHHYYHNYHILTQEVISTRWIVDCQVRVHRLRGSAESTVIQDSLWGQPVPSSPFILHMVILSCSPLFASFAGLGLVIVQLRLRGAAPFCCCMHMLHSHIKHNFKRRGQQDNHPAPPIIIIIIVGFG